MTAAARAVGSDAIEDEVEGLGREGAPKYLTFLSNDVTYGIDLSHVLEIVSMRAMTRLPEVPDYVNGVMNLRGRVIPVIDIRRRFGQPPREYDSRTCIIVVKIDDSEVGLVADTVQDVLEIRPEDVEPPPTVGGHQLGRFILGLGTADGRVKVLLDLPRLVARDEWLASFAGSDSGSPGGSTKSATTGAGR